jgi:hypothetical protein
MRNEHHRLSSSMSDGLDVCQRKQIVISRGEQMSDSPSDPAATTAATSFKFDATRWSSNDRTVAIASFVFFISLFLPWFGVPFLYGGSLDGLWRGYMYITLIVSLALIVYLVLLAGLAKLPFTIPTSHGTALFVATGIDFVLTLISFLTKPSVTSWQYGAYIGLLASAIAFAPFAVPAIRSRVGTKS